MAKYEMSDGTLVDTKNATNEWSDNKARNEPGREELFRSRRGRFYVVHYPLPGTEQDTWAEWISNEKAAAWLLKRDHQLPYELEQAADRITE